VRHPADVPRARGRLAFGVVFGSLAAVALFVATELGGAVRWPVAWTAVALAGVGGVYVLDWTRAFGKRADGTLSPLHLTLWWPFLLLVRLLHEAQRMLLREAACDEVAPGLWVGRRPRQGELPPGVTLVVDLCAELPAATGVATRARHRYLASPVLDATAPTDAQLERVVEAILAAPGPVLVHCAAGHGRSAAVAAAAAIARGHFDDLAAAEAVLRVRRRWIRLNREQRAAVERFSAARASRRA
jgi:protein-tyrosine phosphatase